MRQSKLFGGMAAGAVAGVTLGWLMAPKRKKGMSMRAGKKWLKKASMFDW